MKKTLLALALVAFSSSVFANTDTAKTASQAVASAQNVAKNALVLQSDFSLRDGAVASMKGLAFGVDRDLKMFDLTHEIPPYNIWDAAYRLYQTATYWPEGTVFVSVVDPGVGTDRKSVVLKTKTGHYFVSPDNGTLTLVAEHFGIESVREIDPKDHRFAGAEKFPTFDDRDIYTYVGARLASGQLSFEQVGAESEPKVEEIVYQHPTFEDGVLRGNIPILDIQYGNIWTNISADLLEQSGIQKDGRVCVEITEQTEKEIKGRYTGTIPYKSHYGDVEEGRPLLYLNALSNVSIALNMDSFAEKYKIKSGAEWSISIKSCEKKE